MNSKEKFKKKLIEIREKHPDISFEEWKKILIDALETVVRESLISNKKSKIQPDKDQTTPNWATILSTTKEEREQNKKALREWKDEYPEMAQAMLESDLRTST